jgi:hypothetical protein
MKSSKLVAFAPDRQVLAESQFSPLPRQLIRSDLDYLLTAIDLQRVEQFPPQIDGIAVAPLAASSQKAALQRFVDQRNRFLMQGLFNLPLLPSLRKELLDGHSPQFQLRLQLGGEVGLGQRWQQLHLLHSPFGEEVGRSFWDGLFVERVEVEVEGTRLSLLSFGGFCGQWFVGGPGSEDGAIAGRLVRRVFIEVEERVKEMAGGHQ